MMKADMAKRIATILNLLFSFVFLGMAIVADYSCGMCTRVCRDIICGHFRHHAKSTKQWLDWLDALSTLAVLTWPWVIATMSGSRPTSQGGGLYVSFRDLIWVPCFSAPLWSATCRPRAMLDPGDAACASKRVCGCIRYIIPRLIMKVICERAASKRTACIYIYMNT